MIPVLENNNEDIEKVRKHFETNSKEIGEKVVILREWIKQQPHLPQDQDDDFLEKILLRNKFRIEQAKTKLDKYYSMKGQFQEYFEEDYSQYIPSKEIAVDYILPKLLPQDQTRVRLFFVNPLQDPTTLNFTHSVKYFILQMEMIQKYDYAIGERFLFDINRATLDLLKRISIIDALNSFKLYQEAFSGRILSVDIYNHSTLLPILIGIFRMALPAKIFERIRVINSQEELLKLYPKECLPKDYGGDLPSLNESMEKLDKIFVEHQEFFKKCATTRANESLRVGPVKYNENFGVDGTFKKLNVD